MFKLKIHNWLGGRLNLQELEFPTQGHLDDYISRNRDLHRNDHLKVYNHEGEPIHCEGPTPPDSLTGYA